MWGRRGGDTVPAALVAEVDDALAGVATARQALDEARRRAAPLLERRAAHAALRSAFVEADRALLAAARTASARSFREGSRWRHRRALLGQERQHHLFDESDDLGVLPVGSVRAIDTGMSGPALGDHLHGECGPAGTPARYGIDLEAALTEPPAVPRSAARALRGDVTELRRAVAEPTSAPRVAAVA